MLKVLKYDWRSGWNSVRATLIAALIMSVIVGAVSIIMGGEPIINESNLVITGPENGDWFIAVLAVVWVSVMVALLVQTIGTFFRNMVGRMFGPEGYLTHTLPVKTWQLLLGKAVGTWLFGVFMVFAAFVCIFLMMLVAVVSSGYVGEMISTFVSMLPKLGAYHFQQLMTGMGYAVYGFVLFLVWSFLVVLQFQFICIAARQFGRFHVAGGIIVFVILANIESWLNNAISLGFVVLLIVSVACFFGSKWLLKNRLSL